MKKFSLFTAGLCLITATMSFSSCVNENGITEKEYKQSTASEFDFSTIKDVKLSLSYNVGNLQVATTAIW